MKAEDHFLHIWVMSNMVLRALDFHSGFPTAMQDQIEHSDGEDSHGGDIGEGPIWSSEAEIPVHTR